MKSRRGEVLACTAIRRRVSAHARTCLWLMTHPKIALEERPQLVVLLKDWVLAYPREPTLQCDAHKAVVWRCEDDQRDWRDG
jgi:hypothetical protein